MSQSSLSAVACIDDKEVDQITITVRLREGLDERPSSTVIERVTAKWLADSAFSWIKHCIDTNQKTL
jgi:hypothetical protein